MAISSSKMYRSVSDSYYFVSTQEDTELGPVREIDLTTFAEDSSGYSPAESAPVTTGARSRITLANGAMSNNGNVSFAMLSAENCCLRDLTIVLMSMSTIL